MNCAMFIQSVDSSWFALIKHYRISHTHIHTHTNTVNLVFFLNQKMNEMPFHVWSFDNGINSSVARNRIKVFVTNFVRFVFGLLEKKSLVSAMRYSNMSKPLINWLYHIKNCEAHRNYVDVIMWRCVCVCIWYGAVYTALHTQCRYIGIQLK